jgi:cation diffusion facilitator family transporter
MEAHDLAAHAHHQDDEDHNRSGERRTRWVVLLCAVMMLGELIVGGLTGSMALIADGWHMGTHVGALGFALIAYWYARTRAGADVFSFGTGKVYSLAGYTSGVLLALAALWMVIESVERLVTHPPDPIYVEALPVAAVGLLVNIVSAIILGTSHHYHGHGHGHHGHDHHDHKHDHHDHDDHKHDKPVAGTLDFNLRAAYIHIIADAVTSVLAIVALGLGWWSRMDTGDPERASRIWFLDPAMGLVGGAVITWWAVSLCRQASRQLLDVVSSPAHEQLVRERLQAIDDVRVADLHVWELGPGRRSCIVSIVTAHPRALDFYRDVVLRALSVAHLTIEVHECGLAHDGDQPARPVEVAHRHEH